MDFNGHFKIILEPSVATTTFSLSSSSTLGGAVKKYINLSSNSKGTYHILANVAI